MEDPSFLADLIVNATAASILAAVLYFGFRLLNRLIDLADHYFQAILYILTEISETIKKLT